MPRSSASYYLFIDYLEVSLPCRLSLAGRSWGELARRAKYNDAIMTGILVTKFKMGQISVEDLEQMASDESRAEKCSAAKRVLSAVRDACSS